MSMSDGACSPTTLILWSCKVSRQALPPLKHHDGREGAL